METPLEYVNEAYAMAIRTARTAERLRSVLVMAKGLVQALADVGEAADDESLNPELLAAMEKTREVVAIADRAFDVVMTKLDVDLDLLFKKMEDDLNAEG